MTLIFITMRKTVKLYSFIVICLKKNNLNTPMIDSNRPYRRTEIDKVFTKAKATMQQAALVRGGDAISFK
jgi:hypothetical protein